MTSKSRHHLKTRASPPFNISSKDQERVAQVAADLAWDEIVTKYPDYEFNNLASLGRMDLDAAFCVDYLNRGLKKKELPLRDLKQLQAVESASGIRPDGGVFFVKSKDGDFNHIIGALEVKHQGEYAGYTPLSDSVWKRDRGDPTITKENRPPQAQGNAIERFAKNANAIRTLTSFYGYNPYVVMCEGFDFHRKEDFSIFQSQPYSNKYKDRDSSIIMRLIAGNEWLPVNNVYVNCVPHGDGLVCPATIMARMPKWSDKEVAEVLVAVMALSVEHLQGIGELS